MDELLKLIAERTGRQEGVYGIRRASDYLRPFVQCVGDEVCQRSFFPSLDGTMGSGKLAEALKAAEQKLVYSNEDTVPDGSKLFTSSGTMAEFCKQAEIEVPAKAAMVFVNVVTTPKKDRDGDSLKTGGAVVDKHMPLLWHHMLPMPIGKMLKVLNHDATELRVASAIIDSQLGVDAASLVEFGALRISHGFRPMEYKLMDEGREHNGMGGYDITKFEIMEESLVSVPSNTDAVILAYSRGKLHDPTVKQWAKVFHDARPVVVPGATLTPAKAEPCGCKGAKPTEPETKESPSDRPYGSCVTCGSALDDTSTCTNSNCGQIQSATVQNKAGRVLSSANFKKLEQARDTINDVLSAASVKEEPHDTEDDELEPNNLRQPSVADVIQFVESSFDRSTLGVIKSIVERRDAHLEDEELRKAILQAAK